MRHFFDFLERTVDFLFPGRIVLLAIYLAAWPLRRAPRLDTPVVGPGFGFDRFNVQGSYGGTSPPQRSGSFVVPDD